MGNWFSKQTETRGAQQLATNSTDMGIQLKVCGITGEEKTIDLCDTEEQFNSITVLQLKEKIIEKFGYPWQPSELHLMCSDRDLEEPDLLSQCGIRHMSTISVVLRLPSGGPHPQQQEASGRTTAAAQPHMSRCPGTAAVWLNVRGIEGKLKTIHLCDTEEQFNSITVLQLKEKIKEEFGYPCHPSDFMLICGDRDLEEPALLSQCGIRHMSTINVVHRLRGGGGSHLW